MLPRRLGVSNRQSGNVTPIGLSLTAGFGASFWYHPFTLRATGIANAENNYREIYS
jgi:hypothetical protein